LDTAVRFARMQNHSGEHIISGIVHRLYGYKNVGFHLGDRNDTPDVTLDFDGVLTREQLNEIEDEANAIVTACLPIKAYYPAPEALSAMSYRAKLDLTEGVRIVQIGADEDVKDLCACCAPHVDNTGEIGLIKLLDFIHYKGGVRIHMLCGPWALRDYRNRYAAVASMAAAMSVKQEDVTLGFETLDRYEGDHAFMGDLVGRYGNRIAKAHFTLDGAEYNLAVNNNANHLHGGAEGFNTKLWKLAETTEGEGFVYMVLPIRLKQ
jgi:alanyl-tRNA synthetase